MRTARRICCLAFVAALATAGAPFPWGPCGTAQSACAAMLAAAGCPAQPGLTTDMSCCHGAARAGAAPAPAGVGAPGVWALPAFAAHEPPPSPPLRLAADGAMRRAALRHEIGVFLLVEVFRI